jgi:rare lipoprotein A (peptidoglycan hydrolase)
VNTPHGRHARLRKPALAAMTVAALGAPAVAPAEAQTPPNAATIKLKTSHHVLAGKNVKVRGLFEGSPGRRLFVQRTVGKGWRTVGKTLTETDGSFRTKFPGRNLGVMKIRVVTRDGAQSEVRRATVYRRVFASYYGPGLYGNRLACGGTLTPRTVGVAHKSMPCGTKVRLRHRGRTVTTRVIDRGPYVGGRTYDLTEATKRKLGFGSTGTVWSSK